MSGKKRSFPPPATHTPTHTLLSGVVVFPCLLEPSLWTLSHCSGRRNGVDVGKPSHRNSESSLSAIMDPPSAGHSTAVAKDILHWVLAWANLSSFGTCTWTIQDNDCKVLYLSVHVFPRWVLLLSIFWILHLFFCQLLSLYHVIIADEGKPQCFSRLKQRF